MMPYFTLLEQ